MCFHTIVWCGICGTAVGRHVQATCPPGWQQAPNHRVLYHQPYAIQPPVPYSCPNRSCIASNELHFALRNQQAVATQQGKANVHYTPFHETKALNRDHDEACDLALDPAPVEEPQRVRQAPPAPPAPSKPPVVCYPPRRVQGVRLSPQWLSRRQWHRVRELHSRGKNVLEIAEALGKNASSLRTYMDVYLHLPNRNVRVCNEAPLPSASSTNSTAMSTYTESDDGVFPLDHEIMVPQQGMPHPAFLDRNQQEIVWRMFQQNETVGHMADVIKKQRHRVTQYINAYLRPKLLKLQAQEREAEDRMGFATHTPTTTLPTLAEVIPGTLASEPVGPVDSGSGYAPPRLSREPSLHGIEGTDLDALLDPLLFDAPAAAVPGPEAPNPSGDTAALIPPRTASDEDSLYGDSPVIEKNMHVGPPTQIVSTTHNEGEKAQEATRKRKIGDESEEPAEPRPASKRVRHHSLP